MHRNVPVLLSTLLLLGACSDQPTTPAPDAATLASGVGEHGGGRPGSIVFTHRPPGGTPVNLWLMNADGSGQTQLTFSPAGQANVTPDWSPNGKQIAFASNRTGNSEIYVMNADGSDVVRLTHTSAFEQGPVWSPNGKQVAFHSNRDGDFELYVMDADGSNVRQLTDHAGVDQYPDWSPNGKTIAFQRDGDIYLLNVSDGSTMLLWNDPVFADMPEFSPNGKQITFMSRSGGGRCNVFVIETEGGDPANLTPKPADAPVASWCNFFPSWSKNGQQVFFGGSRPESGGDAEIWAINADGGGLTRLTHQPGVNSAAVQR